MKLFFLKVISDQIQGQQRHPHRGFALVVSLTMMVLLTAIAVSMLSLSAITLRSANQAEAMLVAKANARVAMMIAIGELQKAAGPDQRITAPANLRHTASSPAITGVWQSWKPDPGHSDYEGRKQANFLTWLASNRQLNAGADFENPPGEPSPSDPAIVTLLSDRVLPTGIVPGAHLGVIDVPSDGAMAWVVIDEGVKARMDLPHEAQVDEITRGARLRAPSRPQPESIADHLIGLRMTDQIAPKVASLAQAELQIGNREMLRPMIHDLTTHSMSLLTNVAEGGLKGDLTRAFEDAALPRELNARHLYSDNDRPLVPADPRYTTLAEHYRLYRNHNDLLQVTAPRRYIPIRSGRPNLAPPDGAVVAPVVTNVSVVFSLVSRVSHGGWISTIPAAMQNSQMTQMVYLIYTPVVTVYNPYSQPIEMSQLKVSFKYLPVAFKFFRNNEPMMNQHALRSSMHVDAQNRNDWDDPFGLTASTAPGGGSSSSNVVLQPGEARVFGVSHSADTSWGVMTNYLWKQGSLDDTKTKNVFSGAGWDYRSGFIVDWLIPNISDPTQAGRRRDNNQTMGVFGVTPDDVVNVEVMPMMPGGSQGRFTVEIEMGVGRRTQEMGIYQYTYGNNQTLDRVLRDAATANARRSPFPFRMERNVAVGPGRANSIFMAGNESTPIRSWGSSMRPFAIFSLSARTANDSLYPGKPGITSSFVHHVLDMDATRNHPALLPMEMQLRPITGVGTNVNGSIDADFADRAFYFSGRSRGTGAISHISLDVPRNPLLNLADLRHANLSNSGHLPLTQMTIGESIASPYVESQNVRQRNDGFGYEVPDHAWLSNHVLWDRYFFSGIRNPDDARVFFETTRLPINPRIAPVLPAKTATQEAVAMATAGENAWKSIASMVGIRGGFNVNSTSVDAWKAVLSSLQGSEIPVLGPVEVNVQPANAQQRIHTANQTPFPRQSRPIAGSVNPANADDNTLRWSGFRELGVEEVDLLAREIVREVRDRGPFLSMAEFVNRRIGSGSFADAGALESAVRRSGINERMLPVDARRMSPEEAASFGFANREAAIGHVEEGAAGMISQGDILSAIGAHITVRSDTFIIRTYGDARTGNKITARAWCEAVVQRIPDFVDSSDLPGANSETVGRNPGALKEVNQRFGRRFQILSFRWLNRGEV